MKVYSFRYMWTSTDTKNVGFKIVTDTESGIKEFEKGLVKALNKKLVSLGREYLCEYDCEKIGYFEKISSVGGENNEA